MMAFNGLLKTFYYFHKEVVNYTRFIFVTENSTFITEISIMVTEIFIIVKNHFLLENFVFFRIYNIFIMVHVTNLF